MTSLTLEQAAYIAEVIAVATIVISIFYLAQQVRQGNVATNLNTVQRVSNGFNEWYRSITEDEKLAALYRRGLEGLDQLDSTEQVRFIALLNRGFRSTHEMHYYRQKGLVDELVWHTVTSVWMDALQTKGWQDYWSMKKHWYSSGFQDLVDNLFIASADRRPLYPDNES